jgi:hypothetical protein
MMPYESGSTASGVAGKRVEGSLDGGGGRVLIV